MRLVLFQFMGIETKIPMTRHINMNVHQSYRKLLICRIQIFLLKNVVFNALFYGTQRKIILCFDVPKLLKIICTILLVFMQSEQRYIRNSFNPKTFQKTNMNSVVCSCDLGWKSLGTPFKIPCKCYSNNLMNLAAISNL